MREPDFQIAVKRIKDAYYGGPLLDGPAEGGLEFSVSEETDLLGDL